MSCPTRRGPGVGSPDLQTSRHHAARSTQIVAEGADVEELAADVAAQVVALLGSAQRVGGVGDVRIELADGLDLVAQVMVVERPDLLRGVA